MIEQVVTSGTFSLDGGTWEVDNNVWLVGDDREVIVIDAAQSAEAIAERVGDRSVCAIACTHAHNDHVNAAAALAGLTGAPILLHPRRPGALGPAGIPSSPTASSPRSSSPADQLRAPGRRLRTALSSDAVLPGVE